ncbi:major tail protein [Granulicatella adiacens]|jgi:phage major tail protein|nr:MAG TPA: major tail protein [Caudoviricetes sp.]
MARIGVRNLHVFPLTKDDATGATYGTAVKCAPLMKVSLTAKTSEGSVYGDDRQVDGNFGITGYDIVIDTTDLTPDQQSLLLGHKKDSKGGITVSTEDEAPYVGVAFESKRSDGKNEYSVLYKVKFSPTNEEYETKGENITYKTPSLVGKAIARENDSKLKYTVVSATTPENWYTTPQKSEE